MLQSKLDRLIREEIEALLAPLADAASLHDLAEESLANALQDSVIYMQTVEHGFFCP